jgi:hypothetical protein
VDGVTGLVWLTKGEHRTLRAVMDRLIPGAGAAGAADYVDRLLGAFSFDPPRIFAGGPFSGRHGGEAGFDQWLELGPVEEIAWRIRIEGTQDLPDRTFNGPVVGWQDRYRAALATLGEDLAEQSEEARGGFGLVLAQGDAFERRARHNLPRSPLRLPLKPRKERQERSRRPEAIAKVEVIRPGIVEVDGALHQPHLEDPSVVIEGILSIASQRRDVVKPQQHQY